MRGVRIVRRDADDQTPFRTQIVPLRTLDAAEVDRLKKHLDDAPGPIVTAALPPNDQTAFLDGGFVVKEALHLFRHGLDDVQSPDGPAKLRGGRRGDLQRVLDIDRLSFDDFWVMDRDGLTAARRATPVHRYRVAVVDGTVVGYIVCGRAANTAFLQRLGVHPDQRGLGIGSQLIRDGLDWARKSPAATMLVNTQVTNERATDVYVQHGFILDKDQLKVLEWVR